MLTTWIASDFAMRSVSHCSMIGGTNVALGPVIVIPPAVVHQHFQKLAVLNVPKLSKRRPVDRLPIQTGDRRLDVGRAETPVVQELRRTRGFSMNASGGIVTSVSSASSVSK